MGNIEKKLIEKSIESFTLAVELYNKPTIKYRVEGFSMFICNAWELMLKAHMLKTLGPQSIYYKDNPSRTLTLENCIQKVFTNNKDPLRVNLEKIIDLRNTSTHFITEEYEMIYIPLFQSCVFNFCDKINKFHNVDISRYVSQSFLTLSVSMRDMSQEELIAKYPKEIADKLMSTAFTINNLSEQYNETFAIKVEHHFYITKNKERATLAVRYDANAENTITVVKEVQDPQKTHPFPASKCVELINKRLNKEEIQLKINNEPKTFTSNDFRLFCTYFNLKANEDFCFKYQITTTPTFSYSVRTIDFIVEEIKKDPENIIQNLKESLTKNKPTPGAKEF